MKFDKSAFFSSVGLSVIHFALVLVTSVYRQDIFGEEASMNILEEIEAVVVQPGIWVADFMGCIPEKPMWWIFLVANSVLWGNVIAFTLRMISKLFVKNSKPQA